MTSFGKRLQAERARLGLSQHQFAELGGVKRSSQHLYEHDVRRPDVDYLSLIQGGGVDVGYLISGRPSRVSAQEAVLTESQALAAFRAVEEFVRKHGTDAVSLQERERLFKFLCSSFANVAGNNGPADLTKRLEARWAG